MKKVLYISPNDPTSLNGGAIGTKKFLMTFKRLEEKKCIKLFTFISSEGEIKKESFSNKIYVKRSKTKALISRLMGYADQLELHYCQILKMIEKEKIDVVILQSSRLGNIAEKIKCNCNIKIIQNFDNFEYLFSEMYTKNKNKIIRNIELKNTKKSEKKALDNSDFRIFLTQKDYNDVEKFYKTSKKSEIIPLLYETEIDSVIKLEKEKIGIFTGSLNMEANIEATIFLIKNFNQIKKQTNLEKLIIAGRNPDVRIYEEIKKYDNLKEIEIYKNPSKDQMRILLKKSLVYISPVFVGSGMKTKVLEAISSGLPIVASSHSLIGYDWFNINDYDFIRKFDDFNSSEMIKEINAIYKRYQNYNLEDYNEILNFYKSNFDSTIIIDKLSKIILGD